VTPAEKTLSRVRGTLRAAVVRAREFDVALDIGRTLGQLNWHNNDGLLSEEHLEEELHHRHGAALAPRMRPTLVASVEWLHVISEAYVVGGHTRLLEMLLDAQRRAGATVAVAVTRSAAPSFVSRAEAAGAVVHALTGTPSMRAAGLVALGRAAQRIVLHIHPDDLGAALAARQLQGEGRQVLFVNHADHVFSYGVGGADLCLEVSGFGWRISEAKRPVRAQHFLGIPVTAVAADTPPARTSGVAARTILSMGSSHKYKPAGGYDLPAFISNLLDHSDATAEMIGPSASDPWWASALARHAGRLRLSGPLPFAEAATRFTEATAYVDSFPINGGTAFPQALMAGMSVFGPGADAGGYNLADALRFPSLTAMTHALTAFLADGIPPARESEIRRRIAVEYNADAVAARLAAAAGGRLCLPPPELLASPRTLDWYPQMWRAEGLVHVDLASSQHMAVAARAALGLQILARDHVRVRPAGRRWLLRWAASGRIG